MTDLTLVGEFANLTMSGSVMFSCVLPFSLFMAISASDLWSNRTKPTPFDTPKLKNVRLELIILFGLCKKGHI
jgi:hypothetical protein